MVLGSQDTSRAAVYQRAAVDGIAAAESGGSQAADASHQGRPLLRLAWFDTVGLPDACGDRMRAWVEEIFAGMSTSIEWYEPSSVSSEVDAEEPYYLKVILLDKQPASWGHSPSTMGVRLSSDFPPDAVFLFNPVIQDALRASRRRPRPLSSMELGRAYGRVLAHEVVHAVANDGRHTERGLMSPTQNRHVLLSAETEVDAETAAAFQLGLRLIRASFGGAKQEAEIAGAATTGRSMWRFGRN